MRKRRTMAKKKTVVALALVSAFAIAGILSLIFVLASQTQNVSSSISITYIADNVTADITAKYWIKGATTKGDHDKQTIGATTINATDPTQTTTLGSVNEALTSANGTIIFEYAFKNLSRDAAFTLDLVTSPKIAGNSNNYNNMNEVYYVSGVERFDDDFVDLEDLDDQYLLSFYYETTLLHQPILKQRVNGDDELLNDTVYVYVIAGIADLRYNANYAGNVQWSLNYLSQNSISSTGIDIKDMNNDIIPTGYEYEYVADSSYGFPVAFTIKDCYQYYQESIDEEDNCFSSYLYASSGQILNTPTCEPNVSSIHDKDLTPDTSIGNGNVQLYINYSNDSHGGHEYEFDMSTSALPEAQQKYKCARCGREHAVTTGLSITGTTLNTHYNTFTGDSLFIPYGVTTVAERAFDNGNSYGNGNLHIQYVYMPPTMTTINSYAFNACPIRYISIPYGVVTIDQYAFQDTHENQQTYLRIPDSVTGIGRYAFWKMKYNDSTYGLSDAPEMKVVLSKNAREIRGGTVKGNFLPSGSFGYCKISEFDFNGTTFTAIKDQSLAYNTFTSLDIPDTVTEIWSEAFVANHNLQSIVIPNGVTKVVSCFLNECTSLTSITMPGTVTFEQESDVTKHGRQPQDFFVGCTSLVNLTGPIDKQDLLPAVSNGQINLTIVGITNISEFYATNQGRFKGCTKIGTLTIVNPESIGYMAFNGCTSLREVNIEGTSLNFLGAAAFSGCTALQYFNFAGCSYKDNSNGQNAFNRLSAIEFKNDVFDQCTSLTSFIIPNGSTFTGTTTFDRCNFKWVYIGTGVTFAVTDQYHDGAFMRCPSSMHIFTAETSQPATWPTGWNDVAYHEAVNYIVGSQLHWDYSFDFVNITTTFAP